MNDPLDKFISMTTLGINTFDKRKEIKKVLGSTGEINPKHKSKSQVKYTKDNDLIDKRSVASDKAS